jgi:uncharacterized membrane protein YozB (DUF420 family)
MLLSGLFPTTTWIIDLVNASFLIITPVLIWSWLRARNGAYTLHRNVQVALFLVLLVVVILFELDLRALGGIFKAVEQSRYAGTAWLNGMIYFHTLCAISTSLLWILLVAISLLKFPRPPKPNSFSKWHIIFGRIGMIDMLLSAVTGVILYFAGFVMTK